MKDWITNVITRELKALRREIESYPSDDDLWEIPAGIANPGGNLALHLAGNLQYFRRQRAREKRLRAQSRRRVRQPRHSARRAAARDRQRYRGGRAGMSKVREEDLAKPFPEQVGGVSSSTGAFLAHFATPSRLSSRSGGLPPPHAHRRREDREAMALTELGGSRREAWKLLHK